MNTVADLNCVLSAVISDVLSGRLEPRIASVVCAAGNGMLKGAELTLKYGKNVQRFDNRKRTLSLTPSAIAVQ